MIEMESSEILERYRHCKSESLSQVFFKSVSNECEYFEVKCTINSLGRVYASFQGFFYYIKLYFIRQNRQFKMKGRKLRAEKSQVLMRKISSLLKAINKKLNSKKLVSTFWSIFKREARCESVTVPPLYQRVFYHTPLFDKREGDRKC